MKILFLSRWYPYPPIHGSKLRIYNLLRGLAPYHEITLLSFADRANLNSAAELQSLCRAVHVVPWKPFKPQGLRARLGFLGRTPRSMVDTFSLEMKQKIEQLLLGEDYDMIIASQVDMAAYSHYFRQQPALFEEAEIGVLYEQFSRATSAWQRFRSGLTWTKHRRYLTTVLKNFQACTVVSTPECLLLKQAVPGYRPIEVIPNCVSLAAYRDVDEQPQPNTLIFTGSFNFYPNYQAMSWFLREVYPLIQTQLPEIRLIITGENANRSLPPARNVTLTGFVDDVRPLIARAWGSIAPIHFGGGTRLKILEAMALGTPVVATSKGAEGLDVQSGQHLLIADTPETFAREVVQLLKDPELRQQLADNAYRLVGEKYNWPSILPRFLDLIEQVAKA